jgi:hypothetical protein
MGNRKSETGGDRELLDNIKGWADPERRNRLEQKARKHAHADDSSWW